MLALEDRLDVYVVYMEYRVGCSGLVFVYLISMLVVVIYSVKLSIILTKMFPNIEKV